jgi:hypothetical protein
MGADGDGTGDAWERNVLSGYAWEVLAEGVGTDRTVIAGNDIGSQSAVASSHCFASSFPALEIVLNEYGRTGQIEPRKQDRMGGRVV